MKVRRKLTKQERVTQKHVAYHEAGHAVAARHAAFYLGEVSVRAQGTKSKGHSNHASSVPPEECPRAIAFVSVAGFAAERRVNSKAQPWISAHTDFREAATALGHLTPFDQADPKRDAAIEEMLALADTALDREWPVVVALAERVLERETISGREVAEIVATELLRLGLIPAHVEILDSRDGQHSALVEDDGNEDENANGQVMAKRTDRRAPMDRFQFVHAFRCRHCGHEYGAPLSEMKERKCPECQGGPAALPL